MIMSYYNIEQAIDLFQKNPPEPMLPFDLPQLADLCRKGILTPVFPYYFYISKPCFYEDSGRPRYAPNDTNKFSDYLTHDNLISLIDGYTDSLSLTNAAINAGDDIEILLFNHYQPYPEDAECDPFTVTLKSIRLSAENVQNYINSQFLEDLSTPEQKYIAELESEIKDLKEQLNKANTAVAATKTSQPNKIDDSLLTAIHDKSHDHHAPDLSHAIKLWSDLYINGMIGTDSHSNKADMWIGGNTSYGNNTEDSSVKRLRQVTTPLKDFGGQRKR